MRKISKCRYLCFGLIMVALVFYTVAYQTSVAGEVQTAGAASISSPLKIVDTIPQPAAGIRNSIRVYEDTSFAVLIESEYGINLADPASIRFQIADGEHAPYERGLSSPAVRVIEVENYSTEPTLTWVVYDRSLDLSLPPVYSLDAVVQIRVDIEDSIQNRISAEPFEFKIESDSGQAHAFDQLPESEFFNVEDPAATQDAGIEIVSGILAGARILYVGNEPLIPGFGPVDEVEPVADRDGWAIGMPLNLMPHTVFNRPVKLLIPYPEEVDLNQLAIYYHNGAQWLPACDADGNLLSGGRGWMVPGSRVNHPANNPPLIEIEVYHFSATQAAVFGSSTTTNDDNRKHHGSGATVVVSCFIDSAASEGISLACLLVFLSLLAVLLVAGRCKKKEDKKLGRWEGGKRWKLRG